jgi:hypothetical protein
VEVASRIERTPTAGWKAGEGDRHGG